MRAAPNKAVSNAARHAKSLPLLKKKKKKLGENLALARLRR